MRLPAHGGGIAAYRRCYAAFKHRGFRSDASLEAIANASTKDGGLSLVLYNYPSISGAFAASFVKTFHSRLGIPCLILPFSSVLPFKVEDFKIEGLENCYMLDFIGPKGFASRLSEQSMCKVTAFDHRMSAQLRTLSGEECSEGVTFHIDVNLSSTRAVYNYFSEKLPSMLCSNKVAVSELLDPESYESVETILKYLEDVDLRRWNLPDVKAFKIGIKGWYSKLNCITNPTIFEELLKIKASDLIAVGNSLITSRESLASSLLDKAIKIRLGGGQYGECLVVRADGLSHLNNEIGLQLSIKSREAGLRPIGAVVYLQGKKLKMCLRSTDTATDTSEISKAYGGGGKPHSSSFIVRMDDYNLWTSSA